MSFECTICQSSYGNKQRYEKHLLSQKHEINRQLTEKRYTCIQCKMSTSLYSNYQKHIKTQKHLSNIQEVHIINKCEICAKTYKTTTGLSNHKKSCMTVERVKQDPNLLMYVLEQMTKQNETILKQGEQMSKQNETILKQGEQMSKQNEAMNVLMSKIGNTTITSIDKSQNKTFNLNFFLNEECKDAVNWSDFIKNIKVSHEDIDMNSNITDRVIHTICKELDKLGMYKRPIHCTDIKRHKACIKDGDEWKKEQDPLLKQGVTRVSGKYQQIMNEWATKHPMWHEDQELSEKMMDMMNIYMREPSEDKCISTILKHAMIKHEK